LFSFRVRKFSFLSSPLSIYLSSSLSHVFPSLPLLLPLSLRLPLHPSLSVSSLSFFFFLPIILLDSHSTFPVFFLFFYSFFFLLFHNTIEGGKIFNETFFSFYLTHPFPSLTYLFLHFYSVVIPHHFFHY
jgi:hypothetical protein